MKLLTEPAFVTAFAVLNTLVLVIGTGAATGMYIFAIPIIRDGGGSSTLMTRQFVQLITRGKKYMQGGSRILATSLVLLIGLLYRHPDPEMASRWKYFAGALFVAAQVAWYEVVFVFPTNDRLVEISRELDSKKDPASDERIKLEVLRLLEKWRRWHVGRILIPLVAGTIAMYGLLP